MTIKIKYYPATFSFEHEEDLPQFNGYCEVRQEILLDAMYDLEIDSPSHEYEDYVICRAIKRPYGEEWVLTS
jgi:hypothetical protein